MIGEEKYIWTYILRRFLFFLKINYLNYEDENWISQSQKKSLNDIIVNFN